MAAESRMQLARDTDPSSLTTQQLHRELLGLRELIEARLDAMDKAMALFEQNFTRVPTEVDKAISHLKALHAETFKIQDEKFQGIEVQFSERDVRTEKTAELNQKAIDAALQAAKEAVGEQNRSSALAIAKSEAATTKQIDQIVALIQATTGGLNDKIDDIKERLTTIDGRSGGLASGWGYLAGGIMLLIAIISVIMLFKPH